MKATHYTSIHLLTLKTPLTLTQDALCKLPFWYKNQHNYFQTIKVKRQHFVTSFYVPSSHLKRQKLRKFLDCFCGCSGTLCSLNIGNVRISTWRLSVFYPTTQSDTFLFIFCSLYTFLLSFSPLYTATSTSNSFLHIFSNRWGNQQLIQGSAPISPCP